MSKQHSWARQQYEHCYRTMRRENVANANPLLVGIPADIINAADCSYQGNGYNFTGWINDHRFIKFFNAMQSNRYSTWSIPF